MTRDEYLEVLAASPATSNQRCAIVRECDRLGVVDRTERLAVLAALLDLDGLDSTSDLTQGRAGYLVNLLRRTRDRASLPQTVGQIGLVNYATAAAGKNSARVRRTGVGAESTNNRDSTGTAEPVSLGQAIRDLVVAVMVARSRVNVGAPYAGAAESPALSAAEVPPDGARINADGRMTERTGAEP